LDGYAAARGPRANYYRSAKAAVAWVGGPAGRRPGGAGRGDGAGGQPDPDAFDYFGVTDGRSAAAEVYARTGPAAAALAAADAAAASGDATAARAVYREAKIHAAADRPGGAVPRPARSPTDRTGRFAAASGPRSSGRRRYAAGGRRRGTGRPTTGAGSPGRATVAGAKFKVLVLDDPGLALDLVDGFEVAGRVERWIWRRPEPGGGVAFVADARTG
jgi:hypothetical protein